MRTPPNTGSVTVSIDPAGQVATILIHRAQPQTLTPDLLAQLERILPQAASARVVVLRDGDKIASASADQTAPQSTAADERHRWMPLGHRVFDRITQLSPPTIAVLNGLAIGIGADLALACDHRIAAEDAHVGPCEVGLGTIPGWSGSRRLAQLIGTERATRMLHSTPSLDARTACAWGLLTDITPSGRLEYHLDQLARQIVHTTARAGQPTTEAVTPPPSPIPHPDADFE